MHSALLFASFLFIVNGLTQDFECSSLDINTELQQPINGIVDDALVYRSHFARANILF